MRTASPAAGVKHRIYVDEVGNPDLGSSDNPNHRYLGLTGVVLDLRHVQTTVHPQMEALKNKYFAHHPDEPVILHRKEMHKGAAPFEALKMPGVRVRFDEELLGLLAAWDYTVLQTYRIVVSAKIFLPAASVPRSSGSCRLPSSGSFDFWLLPFDL